MLVVKKPPANAGKTSDVGGGGSIPGSGRSPGVGNGNPLQYSCLENPMDRGGWQATILGITKSWTWLSTHTHTPDYTLSLFWTLSGFPGGSGGKESACNAGDLGLIPGLGRSPGGRHGNPDKRCGGWGFNPWVRKIPWSRKWQPTPVFLPGEFPWTEELGWLLSMGLQRVRHDWATEHSTQRL